MPNLLLRGVPEETVGQLKAMALDRRTSMNSVAIAELVAAVRADANARLLANLPNLAVSPPGIVEDVLTERVERTEQAEQSERADRE